MLSHPQTEATGGAHFVVLVCRKFHLSFITKTEMHLFDTRIGWYIPVSKVQFECYYELVTALLECFVATEMPRRKYPPVLPSWISLYLVCYSHDFTLTSQCQIDAIPSRNIAVSNSSLKNGPFVETIDLSRVGDRTLISSELRRTC